MYALHQNDEPYVLCKIPENKKWNLKFYLCFWISFDVQAGTKVWMNFLKKIFTFTFIYKSKYYWNIYQQNCLFSNRFILLCKISDQYIKYTYSLSMNKSYILLCTQSKKEQEGTYVASFLLCVPLFKLILRRPNCISHVLLFSHVNIYHALILSMELSF